MKKSFLIIFILSLVNLIYGQLPLEYKEHRAKADSLIKLKEYKNAADEFQKAFDSNNGKATPSDRYNAACAFALSNDFEKSFYHLFYLAEHPNILYHNYDHLIADTDLNSLHPTEKWSELLKKVKANKDEYEKDFDRTLIAELDTIRDEDQKYRKQLKEIEEKYGKESDEVKAHWILINEKDSINLIRIKKILDERGWLGTNIIGNQGNITLFLVIQHSDLETQEKYLPMMREAVAKGNANSSSLALLEDRVALRKGEKQIYGSQIGYDKNKSEYYVQPLIDPENVDERRTKMGLGILQNYVSRWGITWDPKDYIKKLPEYESMQKN